MNVKSERVRARNERMREEYWRRRTEGESAEVVIGVLAEREELRETTVRQVVSGYGYYRTERTKAGDGGS